MGTITLKGVKSGAFDYNAQSSNFHTSQTVEYGSGQFLCVMFEPLPDSLKYKEITGLTLRPYVAAWTGSSASSSSTQLRYDPIDTPIDPERITYVSGGRDIMPSSIFHISKYGVPGYANISEILNESYASTIIKGYLDNGAIFDTGVYLALATTRHTQKPQLVIGYDETDIPLVIQDQTKYSSGLDRETWGAGKANVIRWYAPPSTKTTYLPVKQTTAKVQWKHKDGNTINEIDINAGATDENNYCQITVPAGVLPAGDIMWHVCATGTNGKLTVSDWFEHKVWDVAIRSASPVSGYVPKAKASTFTWALAQPYGNGAYQYTALTQKTATFRWRAAAGETIHEIACGEKTSVTIPAGTFTTDAIQWQVTAATEEGVSATSEWMELSTIETLSKAEVISPKGEVVDDASSTLFKWAHIISTGTAQTKAELQISTDMQTWTALATVTGAETTYTAPANTLGSGTKYWRVRTYNTDNAAGAWSDAAEFICVGAPAAPAVSIKSQSPRPVIGWQSSEQLAYQVEIDGVYSSGTYYGTEKTWTAPMYIEDGEYIVRVRVQNEYAMWSPWGSAALQVANTAGPAINLTAEAGDTVRLFWSAAGGYHYNFYLIYRNGKLIAKTTEHTYTDLRSIGSVSYQVRGCFDTSSNYRLSNTVTVTSSVPCVTLIDLDSGDVLPLPYSASTHRTTGRNLSRGVQSVQLAGRRYPTIERSMHYAETISVACAFREAEDCAALEALVGKMVAVKTPESKMVSGCLSVLAATADGGFYTTYQFDVEQADVEEVVDIDS